MVGFNWYSYQCFWCWFGSARTQSLLWTQSAQITLDRCMHLLISLYTWSIYIRRHCSQFLQCEDQKTGWCTKAHANFLQMTITQQIEVTIPGVKKSGIVREKISSTVKYTYDNTWIFQLTLMVYIWGIPWLYDDYSLATPPPFCTLFNN